MSEKSQTLKGSKVSHTEKTEYEKLITYGLDPQVCDKIDGLTHSGFMLPGSLDKDARRALKSIPPDTALGILDKFAETGGEVENKSKHLCVLIGKFRSTASKKQKKVAATSFAEGRSLSSVIELLEVTSKRERSRSRSPRRNERDSSSVMANDPRAGVKAYQVPNEAKIEMILQERNFSLSFPSKGNPFRTSGPLGNLKIDSPPNACEVYFGKVKPYIFEDTLIPLFEKYGAVWKLTLMTDRNTNMNRGFVTFTSLESAQNACKELDHNKKSIEMEMFIPKQRFVLENVPKSKRTDEIREELRTLGVKVERVFFETVGGVRNGKNPGFCTVVFSSQESKSVAVEKLLGKGVKVFEREIRASNPDRAKKVSAFVLLD